MKKKRIHRGKKKTKNVTARVCFLLSKGTLQKDIGLNSIPKKTLRNKKKGDVTRRANILKTRNDISAGIQKR